MKILLDSKFSQFNLLSAEEFLAYVKKRGIHRKISDLEYYDKIQVVKPVLRLRGSLHERLVKKCTKNLSIYTLENYKQENLIELSSDDDYKPWKTWLDEHNDPLCMYYHPAQIVGFDHITKGVQLNLSPQKFLEITNPEEYVSMVKEKYSKNLEGWQKAVQDSWLPRIGFLMLLEESYAIHVRQEYFRGKSDENTFDKWQDWKFEKFSPESIMENSPLDKEKILALYSLLARINHDDPIGDWYPLQYIIKRSRKRQLFGLALLSQDYYEFATMVSHFIHDLYDETVLEPDDLGNDGWKERIFGAPFDYATKKTQNSILDYFLFNPPPNVAIVYEGSTEELIIKKILDALDVYLPKSGLLLHNAEGASNIESNFESFFKLAKEQEIDCFVIVDNDKKEIVENFLRNGKIKTDMYIVWQNDFEFDNFGIDIVIAAVNEILTSKSAKPIAVEKVKNQVDEGVMLMNAISSDVRNVNGVKLDELVSKTELAKNLFHDRVNEIRLEYEKGDWAPKLPIEQKLRELFRKYPHYL